MKSHLPSIRLSTVGKKVLNLLNTRKLLLINNVIFNLILRPIVFIFNEYVLFCVNFIPSLLVKSFLFGIFAMKEWWDTLFVCFFKNPFNLIVIIDYFFVLRKLWGVDRINMVWERIILKIKIFTFLSKFLLFFHIIVFEPFWSLACKCRWWRIYGNWECLSIDGALEALIE